MRPPPAGPGPIYGAIQPILFMRLSWGERPTARSKSRTKLKAKARELTSCGNVNSLEAWKKQLRWLVRRWVNYFRLADMGSWLRQLDERMRGRIRMVFWKKWKRVRT